MKFVLDDLEHSMRLGLVRPKEEKKFGAAEVFLPGVFVLSVAIGEVPH